MRCEDCPLQVAFAQYAIERDIQPNNVNYEAIFSGLAVADGKRLEAMTAKADVDGHYAIDSRNCQGPRKTFRGLGRKACSGGLTFTTDERQII